VYYTVTELHAVLAMPCILTVSILEHVEEVDRGELASLSSPWNTLLNRHVGSSRKVAVSYKAVFIYCELCRIEPLFDTDRNLHTNTMCVIILKSVKWTVWFWVLGVV